MNGESSRLLPSIPAEPALYDGVLRLLGFIDQLAPGANGALRFGELGVVLISAKKVCGAVSNAMRLRLTDILCNQSAPPLPRAAVERVYRDCRSTGRPLGETLVASGLVSANGLRAALLKHNGEALFHLARAGTSPDSFVELTRADYDPKFAFSPPELLALLGALNEPARAAAAQLVLCETLVAESSGVAFVRSNAAANPVVIAVASGCELPVLDIAELCRWACRAFDLAQRFDAHTSAARATWGNQAVLVSWQHDEVGYLAFCSSRAAAARILSQVSQRALAAEARAGEQVARA